MPLVPLAPERGDPLCQGTMANVGIDVSKDHLDWTADADAPVQRAANSPAGVRRLVRRLSGFYPWYRLALKLQRFARGRSAGPAAELLVQGGRARPPWRPMDPRIRAAFLALVLAQISHSTEEYYSQFYELFPPAQLLNQLAPGFALPAFIVINTGFVLFGLWCFFFNVLPGTRSARDWMWLWVVVELFNGFGHCAWAIATRGYVPGFATSPILLVLAAYLFHRLRTTPEPTASRSAA